MRKLGTESKISTGGDCRCDESSIEMLSPLYPLEVAITESKRQGWGLRCESRINALSYPFGSITESKIRWWGFVNPE